MAHPHLVLTAAAHDRLGIHRNDEGWLERRWADPSSRVLVVSGTRVRPVDGVLPWVSASEAPDGLRLLLGERDGTTSWAVIVGPDAAATQEGEWYPLRGLLPALAGGSEQARDDAPLVFHALGLAEWHWATRHCPYCGRMLASCAAGHELRCPTETGGCGRTQFPRTDPAVIMLVTDGEPNSPHESCLLGRSPVWPEGRFSTLAGFCETGESLEDAVRREVAEESGVVVGEVAYFGNQPWPLPQSLMLGFRGRAVTTDIELADHELADARWFTRDQLRREAESGEVALPSGVSISRSLIEDWYGEPLPGSW